MLFQEHGAKQLQYVRVALPICHTDGAPLVLVIEIHHSISQNTLSFLVEKIFDFKVDRCPKL